MVRRLSDRIYIEIDAKIRKNKEKADCVIKNISEDYILSETSPRGTDIDLSHGVRLNIEFENPSGEFLSLPCSVFWSKKASSESLITIFCLKIEEKYSEYEDMYKDLFSGNEGIFESSVSE